MIDHLILMRHAKSSWDDPELSDHARPLNDRGRRDADAVARALIARRTAPDLILASDAARTLETAKRLIRIIPGAQTVLHKTELYQATGPEIAFVLVGSVISAEPDGQNLMILAHNPGVSDLHAHLSGQSDRFATGTCAVYKRMNAGPVDSAQSWRLIDIIYPRSLIAGDS